MSHDESSPHLKASNPTHLSRREFLRLTTLLGASAATAKMLLACAPTEAPAIIESEKGSDTLRHQDLSLSIPQRVDELVSQMTLDEKVNQMLYDAPAIERLGVPKYNWWNECLHGVARAGIATVFPQAMGLAATWNPGLIHKVATAISDEARAKHHEAVRQGIRDIYTGLTFWSPNINIFRDPRWGRGQETYGEDPYLTSRIAVEFVKGLQGNHPDYLKVVATPKHFAVHSGPEFSRHHFDAQVNQRDLRETYLPAFKACITEAKAASTMGAYNRVNGEAACASPTLLQTILREEWGFEGYVVSDCGAIRDIYANHQLVSTEAEAAALAVNAGCDLNCGEAYDSLVTAVNNGLITEETINQAVKRLFTARFRLGMFDPPEQVPYAQIPFSVNDSTAHRSLARQAARESIVLLKNDQAFLPLAKTLNTLAVIGPNADDLQVLLGNYHGTPSKAVTPLAGIRAAIPNSTVLYARGCDIIDSDTSGYNEAISLATQAEVVIFVGGLSQRIEGEEGQLEGVGDRSDLSLPPVQAELLKALHATGVPVILLLLNGGMVAVNWANDHLPAIIEAWYPGEEAGNAIADVLFGNYNPSGRLPVTVYKSAADLPPFEDYRMQNRTYRYFTGEPLYPFGYGLSYTTFSYNHLQLSSEILIPTEPLTATIEVTNTGSRAGDEIVQLYTSFLNVPLPVPLRQLQAFERIYLQPGESRPLTFTLTPDQFSLLGDDWQPATSEPGSFRVAIGGGQPDAKGWNGHSQEILIC